MGSVDDHTGYSRASLTKRAAAGLNRQPQANRPLLEALQFRLPHVRAPSTFNTHLQPTRRHLRALPAKLCHISPSPPCTLSKNPILKPEPTPANSHSHVRRRRLHAGLGAGGVSQLAHLQPQAAVLTRHSYDFDYEDDDDDETGNVDIENKYYNAKQLKGEDPELAIDEFLGVPALESEKGDW